MAVIGQINPLWDTLVLQSSQGIKSSEWQGGLPVFEDVFRSAIDNVKQTDAEKNKAEYLMATGQLDNPSTLTIASSKAVLSVQLLVQLRNKALDAYNEVSRMSI